jgi:ABC-type multidrug transport system fused ATPase/permease subunit
MLEIYYSVYFIFFISIVVSIIVWNSNLHKSFKYQQFLQFLIALTVLFTSFAIIIQLYTFSASQSDTEVQIYENMFNDLIGSTLTYFENNPKMNYYYNSMFQPLYYNPVNDKKRYYSEEQQITHSMLQKLGTIVYYLQTERTLDNNTKINIENKIKLFFKNVTSSPIFLENYNNIKSQNRLFSQSIKDYLQEKFNI